MTVVVVSIGSGGTEDREVVMACGEASVPWRWSIDRCVRVENPHMTTTELMVKLRDAGWVGRQQLLRQLGQITEP